MTTIREIVVQSVGEPYSVKIERGMKGQYGYEIGVKSEDMTMLLEEIDTLKVKVEMMLYGNQQGRDTNNV